jgi:hypothetical protein
MSDIGQAESWAANMKRLFDEFLGTSLNGLRASQSLHDRVANNAISRDEQLHNVSLQALQGAVETANMVGKQAVRHSDIAIDRQWNIDEQGQMATIGAAVLGDMAKRTFGSTEMAEIIRGVVASEMSKISKS